jgi:hypothetical protein
MHPGGRSPSPEFYLDKFHSSDDKFKKEGTAG